MSVQRRLEDQFQQMNIRDNTGPLGQKPIQYESTTSISSVQELQMSPQGGRPYGGAGTTTGPPHSGMGQQQHSQGYLYSSGYPSTSTQSLPSYGRADDSQRPGSASGPGGYREVTVSTEEVRQYPRDKGQLSPYAEEEYIPPPSPSRGSYGSLRGRRGGGNMMYHGGQQPGEYRGGYRDPEPQGYGGERSQLMASTSSGTVYGVAAKSVPVSGNYAPYNQSDQDAEPQYPYNPNRRSSGGSPAHEGKPPYSPTQRSQSSFPGSPGSPRSYNYPPGSPLSTTSNTATKGKEAEVDALTNLLLQNMEASADPEYYGMCSKCNTVILGADTGCSALDQMYHIDCFTCSTCGVCLKGQPFFALDSRPYCEPCYLNTLEKCSVCSKPITDRVLRATGKPYHPTCFVCVVCGRSLDGVPFTVDAMNQIHCIEDFHNKFAPRCCVCQSPITPENGKEETVRIVAMDKSFHVGCYKCEDCGLVLSSEADGRGCYPLDDHILCKACNARWIQAMTTKITTEL